MDVYIGNDLVVKRKRRTIGEPILLVIIFGLSGYISFLAFHTKLTQPESSQIASSRYKTITPTQPVIPKVLSATIVVSPKESKIENAIQSALSGTKGTYGIAIKNIKSGESYFLKEHQVFETGSLYKLWVMVEVYNQIEEGILTEDQILSEKISVLNKKFRISSESAEQTEGTISQTVSESLKKMITVSDNYSSLLLSLKIRLSRISSLLEKNRFTESTVGTDGSNPKTTPYDMLLFFEKLYKGELANANYTEKMIELLKMQKLNNKLPKYLPKNIVIAHKTGELNSVTHDAGIVYLPTGDYLITILSDSSFPTAAEERIAEISKNVYFYFLDQ